MGQDYERDLFFLLHDVARLLRVEADKRARVSGMTRAQWGLLLRLERNPGMSQKEIADLLEVEPISVARLVDRLAAHGLVERRADAEDRRVWRLHLRPAATGALQKIQEQRRQLAESIIGGISPAVQDTMIAALLQMKRNLLAGPSEPVKAPLEIMKESA
jgi:DNA-binding MarR family transcriptional regulator